MSRKGENIYKRKDGRWEGRYKKGTAANGKILYGSCYGKSYREAKERLESCKVMALTGCDNPRHVEVKRFGAYCDEWLTVRKNKVKESTYAKYAAALKNHIKPYFGGYFPDEITTELTADFVDHLLVGKALSAKTAKDLAVLLKTVLKYTARVRKSNHIIEVAMPKNPKKEIRILSIEEQQRFIRYLRTEPDPCKFGVLFSLLTGLRIGEMCALRVGDISFSEKTVAVRKTMQRIMNPHDSQAKTKIILTSPKSDTSARVVPLTDAAYRLCREYADGLAPQAFLLTGSETKYIEPRVLQYRIKKYSADCGIDDLHFHVLRHTFATRCVEVGFEIKSLSEILGHSTPRITLERYVHSSIELKRKNMAKLAAVGL